MQDKRNKYLAELTINFQSYRYFSKSPIYKNLDFENLSEEIKRIREELEKVEDAELINIGTHLEDIELKEKQNFVFFNTRVTPEKLSDEDPSKKGLIFHLIQIHSLKGIKPAAIDNIGHFFYFIKHFWDNDLIDNKNVLVYGEREKIVIEKIEELITLSLKLNSDNPYDVKPNVIIFPENSIPYKSIDYLKKMSQKYEIIFIGGLEHYNEEDKTYTNKAFIIDKGNINYQIKQTPVRISRRGIIENIKCVKNPKIKIFQTSIGKMSIFICKDFLRLHKVIPYWAGANNIDYVVVPSFTNKILPFQSKIFSILDSPDCKNLKILYVSMGEYGGSDFFSIKEKQRIENSFRVNQRDNVGEKIVSRRTLQEIESILSVEEFLNYVFTKNPHVVEIQGINALTTATGADILKNIKEYMQNQGFIIGMQKLEAFEDPKIAKRKRIKDYGQTLAQNTIEKKIQKVLKVSSLCTMDYEKRAHEWFNRALKEEDDFIKFILFFISLEVFAKLRNYRSIRAIKEDNTIKQFFFSKVKKNDLEFLKQKLNINPLQNMKPNGDQGWNGELDSEEDFDGIIEFIIRARNNLFHGDKGLDDERDKFIVSQSNLILPILVKGIINGTIQ